MVNDSANYQRGVLDLVKNIGRSETNREQFERDLNKLNESALAMIRDNMALAASSRELEEAPSIADDIADLTIKLQLMDYAQRLDYIGLARFLENIDPELFEPTLKELSTYEGGEERIRALLAAIGKVLLKDSQPAGEAGQTVEVLPAEDSQTSV
jgi:hypothetical protein